MNSAHTVSCLPALSSLESETQEIPGSSVPRPAALLLNRSSTGNGPGASLRGVLHRSAGSSTVTGIITESVAPCASVTVTAATSSPPLVKVCARLLANVPVPAPPEARCQSSVTSHEAVTGSPSGSVALAVNVTASPSVAVAGAAGDVMVTWGGELPLAGIASPHTPRPWVATRSIEPSSSMRMSCTDTAGRPLPKGCQVTPPSVER